MFTGEDEALEFAARETVDVAVLTIRTIPSFGLWVDGVPCYISKPKVRELLALLVDRGEHGVTAGEGIAVLWPDHPGGDAASALFRMTYKRLVQILSDAGIGDIVVSEGGCRRCVGSRSFTICTAFWKGTEKRHGSMPESTCVSIPGQRTAMDSFTVCCCPKMNDNKDRRDGNETLE